MKILNINPSQDLSEIVNVLNQSHKTVADKFGFTKEDNPSNNAFIDEPALKEQLNNGIQLFGLSNEEEIIGCIAIEKSKSKDGTFYIEKVSVLPKYRKKGYGCKLMDFATNKIKELGGKEVSIALIDSYTELKNWYLNQGFVETGTKDFEHLPFRVCFMNKIL